MGSITVSFRQKKETPGAFQFTEVDDDGNALDFRECAIGAIYLRKDVLDGAAPKEITVTVEFPDGKKKVAKDKEKPVEKKASSGKKSAVKKKAAAESEDEE